MAEAGIRGRLDIQRIKEDRAVTAADKAHFKGVFSLQIGSLTFGIAGVEVAHTHGNGRAAGFESGKLRFKEGTQMLRIIAESDEDEVSVRGNRCQGSAADRLIKEPVDFFRGQLIGGFRGLGDDRDSKVARIDIDRDAFRGLQKIIGIGKAAQQEAAHKLTLLRVLHGLEAIRHGRVFIDQALNAVADLNELIAGRGVLIEHGLEKLDAFHSGLDKTGGEKNRRGGRECRDENEGLD